jgi:hypothetical protein
MVEGNNFPTPRWKEATHVTMARLTAALCALLVLAGCAAGPYSDAAQNLQPLTAATSAGQSAPPGTPRMLDSGLSVTVSAPKSFTPTAAAYPRTPRAVAFDLVIENKGAEDYRPSQLTVTATSNGNPALQVIDSTQGYTGSVSTPTDELPPGQHLRLSVAFAMPAERAEVALTVQPSTDGQKFTLFTGAV